MSTDRDDLEPIEPGTAQKLYLDHKSVDCTEATVRNHRSRIDHFVRWCNLEGINNLNDLTGRDIQRYKLWRKEDGNLNKMTLKGQMSTLRVFLKWAAAIDTVPSDLYDKIMIPRVPPEETNRDEMLAGDDAEEILEYLWKYHYASVDYVVMALLWETGMRLGGLNSLDVDDVHPDEKYLLLEHRPNEGTRLKNGKNGERLVALSPELAQVLTDYIEDTRVEVTDDFGREPLLASSHGRMALSSIRRHVYRVTAPCFRGSPCPGCEGGSERGCSESVSPHAIRRGSITHFLSNDVPVEIVSDRMNVSRKVLDKHYDKRSEEVKLEQRRGYLDNV